MSSNEDKNQKKSKRSFISKLPSFRRKKSPSPETPSPKSTTRPKKHKNENASNAKASITKETQTPKHTPKYRDKSTSRFTDDTERGLGTLKEEEQNGNNAQPKPIKSTSNLNTASILNSTSAYATTTATSFTNPVYEGDVWSLQNQNTTKQKEGQVASLEINANVSEKPLGSPTGPAPLSPVKTSSYQHIARCSSVTSELSSGSSLSLSSPGSLTKLIAGPKPYKSVFGEESRGVKRQGSTPSDIEFGSSCISVSGSVSSLSPTVEDVATKVTVRSGSVPGLHKYPHIAPIASLSPGLSPKHKHDRSRREGAYTYDSSGCESDDSAKKRTLTREDGDASAAPNTGGDISPTSIVNSNFDLQSAVAASPLLNMNVRLDRQKFLASGAQCVIEESAHKVLTAQQESASSAQPEKEEALISQASAAPPSRGLTNNNPELESRREASIPTAETHAGCDSRLSPPQPQVKSSSPLSTPCNNAATTAGQSHENSDQALLTRVRSVTSPIPIKTPRTFYPPQHLQLSAMRNKLRSESFDSSDLDSLASDDLMCEADTFMDPSDESLLTHRSSSMPTEHGFSPCPNSAKGKRMRNNSIEFLVASFDKRHRHHSTGESPRGYSGSLRGVRVAGTGPGTGRDMVVLEANTYRHMVQELSSMKMALIKLSKMLQDPKALAEMLSAVSEGKEAETVTMDSVVQCELLETTQGQTRAEAQVAVSSCEAAMQCEAVPREDRAVQSDATITGCIQCEGCMKAGKRQADPEVLPNRPVVTNTASYHSRDACLSISSSSSAGGDGDEECLGGSWKGSSGLDQGALSPLGNSHSSGDTSDDSIPRQSVKAQRKHVRISDDVSSSPQYSRPKIPSPRASSLPKVNREKISSSDEGSQSSSSRLKQPTVRFGFRVKNGSPRIGQDLSSSDDGNGSSGVVRRRRNQSDSSNEGSDDSMPEQSRLPQIRRPMSKMQRPRQIQRPSQRPTQQKGRRQDNRGGSEGRGIPHSSKPQKSLTSLKDVRQYQEPAKPSQMQDQQANLEWQQLQLQQQQEKLHKQQVAARKQQQESQQRMQIQQQQLQRDQQERASAILQQQQDMLVEQQQQQFQRQQQQQQQWQQQQQQQRSLESVQQKVPRPQGKIIKQSSNQDLTYAQRKSTEAVKAAQEHWHSSPDLIDNQGPQCTHAAVVHSAENQNRSEIQKPKSRLPAPSAVSRLPSSKQMLTKREPNNLSQTRNVTNGIPGPRSKLASPMSPRRSISMPASNVSRGQKQSPVAERRVAESPLAPRQGGTQLQVNQNNSPSVPATHQQQTTTYTTTVTTITTTVLPQTTSPQASKLPSPSKSIPKPVSRLAQPKVKVQSRIPKGPAVSTKSRESN